MAAHPLDEERVAKLAEFITTAQQKLGVPGVSLALYQNGAMVFAGGFGVRELGKPAKVDGDTKYMIASNTKALATLMLAKLVDQKKIGWDTPATQLLPSFKLGDADTTSRVQVKHLICACTGLPRQDMEWLFQFAGVTPAGVMATLATMQPTTKFGELFQYSNPLAAAAGFIGGHVLDAIFYHPDRVMTIVRPAIVLGLLLNDIGCRIDFMDQQPRLGTAAWDCTLEPVRGPSEGIDTGPGG